MSLSYDRAVEITDEMWPYVCSKIEEMNAKPSQLLMAMKDQISEVEENQ